MPSADQLKTLLKANAQGDNAQFYSVAMQIAAGEARIGHGKLAEELRVHHATILEMHVESYRRKAALKRKRGPGD